MASPGQLDQSFGTGGSTLISFGGFDRGRALAIQPDGRIVVVGRTGSETIGDFAVARLTPGGLPDAGFGSAGRVAVNFGAGSNDEGFDVALQPDGMVVAAGETTAQGELPDFGVVRLRPDGTPDPGFGGGHPQSVDFVVGVMTNSSDLGRSAALLPDGRILLGGGTDVSGSETFGVARLRSTGALDSPSDFSPGPSRTGTAIADFPGGGEFSRDIAIQPDGKIVIGGDNGDNFAVARLMPNGDYDGSFGSPAGRTTVDFGKTEDAAALALQPDGKILIAGRTNVGHCCDFAIARLNPDGSPDDSFGGGDGRSLVAFGDDEAGAEAIALQPDGKIVVAGYKRMGVNSAAVARLQPNGSLDSTFGEGGRASLEIAESLGEGVALQPDGKIVVAGYAGGITSDFLVARLEGDPQPPGGPGPGGPGGGTPPRCGGRSATIVGTAAGDALRGTRGRDVIVALGGNDRIRALGGKDLVCAGAGNDAVRGGRGADRLLGQRGNDRLVGEAGADRLVGGPGRDRLLGGPGRDRLLGGGGIDVLRGGPGRDRQRQ